MCKISSTSEASRTRLLAKRLLTSKFQFIGLLSCDYGLCRHPLLAFLYSPFVSALGYVVYFLGGTSVFISIETAKGQGRGGQTLYNIESLTAVSKSFDSDVKDFVSVNSQRIRLGGKSQTSG